MNKTEELTAQYLQSLGYLPIFEPRGIGTFPDFEVTSELGVEVRLLNEHYFKSGKPKGLREESQPLHDRIEAILRTFDEQYNGYTYFIGIHFIRPLAKSGFIKETLKKILCKFLEEPYFFIPNNIGSCISVTFIKGDPVEGKTFLIATELDMNSGGSVIPNFIKNINHCIANKTKKQQPHRYLYQKWWLILVDQICFGVSVTERNAVLSAIKNRESWDKIIILNSLNGNLILEI